MRYGLKVLFEDVTTTFSTGRRYGLTGPNGAGKSTFMKLLAGDLDPQRGTVVRPATLGVLRQDHYAFDRRVLSDSHKQALIVATRKAREAKDAAKGLAREMPADSFVPAIGTRGDRQPPRLVKRPIKK